MSDTLLRAGAKIAAAAQRHRGEQRKAMEGLARVILLVSAIYGAPI